MPVGILQKECETRLPNGRNAADLLQYQINNHECTRLHLKRPEQAKAANNCNRFLVNNFMQLSVHKQTKL